MKPGLEQKDIFRGVFILTIGAILTKILSAVYRIPFQNMVGDVGFYIYQQVYPFYGLALVISTNGFPVIISKFYSEKKHSGQGKSEGLLIVSFLFLFVLSLIWFTSMYIGSEWLAHQMNDPKLAILFRVIAIVFLILPFISVYRGYFQGNGDMLPTATSQVSEQLVRVMTILVLTSYLLHNGYSLYTVGGGAAFGSITGGLMSVFILSHFFWRKSSPIRFLKTGLQSLKWHESMDIVKALAVQGFAVCVTGMLLIFIQMADALNLYSLLVSSGIDASEAKHLKGIYDRGQPLIQLGTVLVTSMSLSLVPLISSEHFKHDTQLLLDKIRLSLQVSIMVGVAGSVGLMCIIKQTNQMLFENRQGSEVLGMLCLLIFLSSVIITISSILQGLGYTVFPASIILLGFALKFLLNIPLVNHYGTLGAAIASVVAMIVILFLLRIKLKRVILTRIIPKGYIGTIAFSAFAMGACLIVYIMATDLILPASRVAVSLQALSAVFIGGLLYLYLVLRKGAFKEEELSLLPFGSKLIYLLPINKRSW
jgi:O-antigen/teichoic acid export membrane protein